MVAAARKVRRRLVALVAIPAGLAAARASDGEVGTGRLGAEASVATAPHPAAGSEPLQRSGLQAPSRAAGVRKREREPSASGDRAPDFVRDVLPILQRQGCASAYCHGAATGQGGFKLSLFGSDPLADHTAITSALGGRRLDLADPDNSLLLQKPLRRVQHGGGKRLREDGAEHERLRAWIAGGAPFTLAEDEHLDDLSLTRSADRLSVEARFAGPAGTRVADVTGLSVFSSSDERTASVDRLGHVTVHGPGEAWLFARYCGQSARLAVVQPFEGAVAVAAGSRAPLDAAFAERLDELGLEPAPPASPERLLRRLHLDLCGMPPSEQALRRFLALPATSRVADTVAELLATPAFAEVAARRIGAWLELPDEPAPGPGSNDAPAPQRASARALWRDVRAFAAGDGAWPELTRRLLVPGAPFLNRHEDPRDRAELVARTMLGVRVGCARCHDHPDDRWRRSDHLAFSACFSDPRPGSHPGGTDAMAMQAMDAGAFFDSETGAEVDPRLLPLVRVDEGGEGVAGAPSVHEFVHDRRHDQAARALCNRVFAWLMGRGLVEPIDDHRETNPAVHEAWLDVLQSAFHAGGQRLRPLVAAIATSRLYALDSPDQEEAVDPRTRFFAARASKPLDPGTLRRALTAVLGVEETVLPRLPASPLARRLELLNGEGMARALRAPGNTVHALALLGGSPHEQLDALFLMCLTRHPAEAEREALLQDFDLHDTMFALLSSREFEFLR